MWQGCWSLGEISQDMSSVGRKWWTRDPRAGGEWGDCVCAGQEAVGVQKSLNTFAFLL